MATVLFKIENDYGATTDHETLQAKLNFYLQPSDF